MKGFVPVYILEPPVLPASLLRRALLEAQAKILRRKELEELREQEEGLPGITGASGAG